MPPESKSMDTDPNLEIASKLGIPISKSRGTLICTNIYQINEDDEQTKAKEAIIEQGDKGVYLIIKLKDEQDIYLIHGYKARGKSHLNLFKGCIKPENIDIVIGGEIIVQDGQLHGNDETGGLHQEKSPKFSNKIFSQIATRQIFDQFEYFSCQNAGFSI